MKKSSTNAILVSCFKKWISPISFFTILVLLFSGKTHAQSSDPFSRQSQFDFKILNQQTTSVNHEHNTLQWETIQTIVVAQRDPNSPLPPTKFNLDQVRNGSGSSPVNPAGWVNGNAGASNAHFVEGWSIPYRVNITDLALGTHSLDIEWDIKHSGANAIDFVTNYDLINFPAASHLFNFGHGQETINPITEAGTWNDGTSSVIPAPNLPAGAVTTYRNLVMASSNASGPANEFSIWNGNITSMVLLSEGSLAAQQSATRMRIIFTNTAADVVIAWGGHIAKGDGVWGAGNSASAVDGSPYHTRLISWDPDGDGNNQTSIGNQDRSLSAAAVQDPPICDLQGPSSLQCSATSTFTSGVASSDLSQGVTFDWEIEGAINCGIITLGNETVGSATVTTSSSCGCAFSVVYIILKNGEEVSRCVKLVTVTDNQAPTITCPSPPTSPISCPATPVFGIATATDNCGTPTITSADATTPGSCAKNYTVTRKWTASDACGNTSTCSQSVVVQDISAPVISGVGGPSTINCPATPTFSNPTASDACGTGTFTPSSTDATTPGTCANRYSVTRKWTATDVCGNSSTASQTITVTDNAAPVISGVGGPSTINCPATPTFSNPTASDACGVGTFTPSSTDATTPGTCTNRYSVTRKWTATDACGNTSTASQTITVTDNTAPVISGVGGPSTIDCPATPTFSNPTASDACGIGTFTPSFTDATTPGTCANNYSKTRKWTATDACGNTATASQTITVRDITPPVITCPPDVTVECSAPTSSDAAGVGSATALDACGPTTVTASDNTQTRNCVTVITRTWKARDACGNTATCVQHIIQKDLTAPTIVCNADGSANITDNCTAAVDIIKYKVGDVWTAIDGSGNIRTASCPVQAGSRIANSQVSTEQKEQPATTVSEEKTKAKAITKAPVIASDVKVNAVPNPFNDRVKFVVNSPQAGYGTLEVMNMLGQKVKTVYQGYINAGGQNFEMVLPGGRNASLFYILRMNGKVVTGKLVQAGVINK